MVTSSKPHILIDVRTEPEMEICALNNSVNVPIEDFQAQSSLDKIVNLIKQDNQIDHPVELAEPSCKKHIVLVCRRGNDSQVARELLKEHLWKTSQSSGITSIQKQDKDFLVCDIIGGLSAWSKRIDINFP